MRRKIIVKKVNEMFAGKFKIIPWQLAQDFNCAWLKNNKSTKRIRKLTIQAVVNRIRHDRLKQFGNFNYNLEWLADKNCWLHNWTFSAK